MEKSQQKPQQKLHLGLKKTNLSIEEDSMSKQKCWLKLKKMLIPKKGSKLNSKAKQATSQECGKSSRTKKRTRVEDLYCDDEAKLSVIERIEEVLNSIADDCPIFIKCMLPSIVSEGFWLFPPAKFCNEYLPKHNSIVTLVAECGKQYETKYLVGQHGLSAGWRGFSIEQRILKGDLLVFELIKPCTFKVHIVRVYGLDEVDAALCLMDLASHAERAWPTGKKRRTERKAKNFAKPPTENDNLNSEVLEGSETSDELGSLQPRTRCSSFGTHNVTSSRALHVAK